MLFLTVFVLCLLCGAEIDLFVPSFPELQRKFNLSPADLELSLSLNLMAHCLTSLFVGSLGDRFGRKQVIITFMGIFIIGSALCVASTSYYSLLLGRIFQGVGISGPAVLAFVIIADNYDLKKQEQLIASMNSGIAFAMAFAPVIGSFVTLKSGWRGNFVALLCFGVVGFILAHRFLPQSTNTKAGSLSIKEYGVVLSSGLTVYTISAICLLLLPYCFFVGISPILYMDGLGVSLKDFGIYQGSLALCFSITSALSSRLIGFFGKRKCLTASLILTVVFLILNALLIINDSKNPLLITGSMLILSAATVFPINILYPFCLDTVPSARGKIAAAVTFFRLVLIACSVQFAGYVYDGSFKSIGLIIGASLGLAFFFCYKINRKIGGGGRGQAEKIPATIPDQGNSCEAGI